MRRVCRGRLASSPAGGRDRRDQAGGLPAAEPDVHADLVVLDEGDVVEEQAGHALAFALGRVRVGPQGGEVSGERADTRLVFIVERDLGGRAGAFVVVLRVLEGAEGVVPVRFEAVGDEPVVGVDGEVAAAGELGSVAGPFDVGTAQRVGFIGAGFELGLDGQGDLERERGDGVQQEPGDGGIDAGAGDGLAAAPTALDRFADALVVGDVDVAAVVVADGHAPPAAPAHHQTLQQGGAFSGGTGGAVVAVGGGVGRE